MYSRSTPAIDTDYIEDADGYHGGRSGASLLRVVAPLEGVAGREPQRSQAAWPFAGRRRSTTTCSGCTSNLGSADGASSPTASEAGQPPKCRTRWRSALEPEPSGDDRWRSSEILGTAWEMWRKSSGYRAAALTLGAVRFTMTPVRQAEAHRCSGDSPRTGPRPVRRTDPV